MNIVIVVYDFRESSLAASYRARKLAYYFDRAGHDVSVICAYASFLPKVKIITVPDEGGEHKSFFQKLILRICEYPDPSAKWASVIINKIKSEFLLCEADLFFVTSPPHGIQKVACYLSKNRKGKVISDLRDDFTGNHRLHWYTPLHYFAGVLLERELVRLSSAVIVNSSIVYDRFIDRYSGLSEKINFISNGYDEEDFIDYSNSSKIGSKVTLSYIGDGYGDFVAKNLEKTLNLLSEKDVGSSYQIETAGRGDWDLSKKYKNWVHHGLVAQKKANEIIMRSNILLMLMPPGEKSPSGTIPLKVFTYLRTGKTIIYYGEIGDLTDLLSDFAGTHCFPREKVGELAEWMVDNRDAISNNLLHCRAKVKKYEFSNIANEVLGLLDD